MAFPPHLYVAPPVISVDLATFAFIESVIWIKGLRLRNATRAHGLDVCEVL